MRPEEKIAKLRSALEEAETSFACIRTMSFSVMNREKIRDLADDEGKRIQAILEQVKVDL